MSSPQRNDVTHPDPRDVLAAVWRAGDQPADALEAVTLTGREPAMPSSFLFGTMAQVSIAASALAAGELWRLRTGRRQRVSIDMRDAAIEFRSERYMRVNGGGRPEEWNKIAGLYRCGDGRWARLHTNLPHHCAGTLKLLGCEETRASVQSKLDHWKAEELETAAAAAGLVITATRSFEEWDRHGQGQAVARLPLLSIERIGDAPPAPLPPAARPLSGIKVLDLTRIIAGPVCGKTLAAHGADVLLITGPHLPSLEPLVIDTGRGKLSAQLDLRQAAARETLAGLIRGADVMVQGYRPGAIAGHGFDPHEAARLRPGIVYVSLCAWGHDGPWAGRRGFDSLVQNANGLNVAEAQAAGQDEPMPLPGQALDHGTGYLLAFGAMAALRRRAIEGGSWLVRLSLAQSGEWLRSLGRIDGLGCRNPGLDDVRDRLEEIDSGFGRLTAVRHSALMSETPALWARPTVPLGTHAPAWPA
jgi:crotonobetainyl-CoA:carnitine CoA-transferase CaiB-like acyl-CoA transferase